MEALEKKLFALIEKGYETDKEAEAFAEQSALIMEQIVLGSEKQNEVKKYTKTELNKTREADVVDIAISLGLKASVDDLKKDTITKILDHQSAV